MQCVYALIHSKDDSLEKQERFLKDSIDNMYTLYLLLLSLLREIRDHASNQVALSSKKYLENASDTYPDKAKFANNAVLLELANNAQLSDQLTARKLNNW